MTNYQYYEKEIIDIFKSGYGVGIHKGKPVGCGNNKCVECDWYPRCYEALGEWLEKEHIATEDEARTDEILKFAQKIKSHMMMYCQSRLEQQYCALEVIDYIGKLIGEKDFSVDVEKEMSEHDEQVRADAIDDCVRIVQKVKDDYNDSRYDKKIPINYGTICGIIISLEQLRSKNE